MNTPSSSPWQPSREAALRQIEAFVPAMGRHYSSQRNFDFGPNERSNTSILSPYLRRRLVTEAEVVTAALDAHTLDGSEKFVQEVFWRTYFKGWLERRPSVWSEYRRTLDTERERLDGAKHWRNAEAGATGIACFDAWAQELVETNYLHNHTRMWFASIWIFTLGLPWQLGADFFLRHLLDGDPASNTLSWRWVAGLHTKGKNYAAAPWNIAKFTNGRFTPEAGDLAQDPEPLTEAFDPGPALTIRGAAAFDPAKRSGLLVTVDDCMPANLGITLNEMSAAATLRVSADGACDAVIDFDTGALVDASTRATHAGAPDFAELDANDANALVGWARDSGIDQIVTAFVPVGPTRDWLDAATPALADAGISVAEVKRKWDDAVWPHAAAGFFKVKKKIPRFVETLLPS